MRLKLTHCLIVLASFRPLTVLSAACRNTPGDPGFPTSAQWAALNASVSGQLVPVVPSAKACQGGLLGFCTLAQWTSARWRAGVPGAMNQVNWEQVCGSTYMVAGWKKLNEDDQDYASNPPSLCLRNTTATCGQGDVALYAILAESARDIQAGVKFARDYNLRLTIKASGHDYLGRSTAKNSLLIHTHKLQAINFTDDFIVDGKSKGSAVTVGSGVALSDLYTAALSRGKFVVGGSAATVVAAGGYFQGGGHSATSPLLGLAADNTLEINVIIANGSLVTANEVQNNDLFWAMRGGGAGSWGVIISATFQTFPTYLVAKNTAIVSALTPEIMGNVISSHARHIFDWDSFNAGQYFYISGLIPNTGFQMLVSTYFPEVTALQAEAALLPFFTEARLLGAIVTSSTVVSSINSALTTPDDIVGSNLAMGSRLIPASVYQNSPQLVGQTYTALLKAGATNILGNLVAGGKVAANANISSAINPTWRTAKTHVIIANNWDDSASIDVIRTVETTFRDVQLPILQRIAPAGSGSYTNEADLLEPDFKTTFYGPNYAQLSAIKRKYDPDDLFIVAAGVGSERWDSYGICQV